MSRIFKRNDINIDGENKVFIKHKNLPQEVIMNFKPKNDNDNSSLSIDEAALRANEIIENALREAEEIKANAQEIAENLIDDATRRQSEIYDEAKNNGIEDGYQEGYEAGVNEGKNTLEDLISEQENQVLALKEEKEAILINSEKEIIDLVVEIVDDITYKMFNINPEILSVLVKRGISNATIQNKVSIKVSSEDYENVVEHVEEFKKLIDSSKEVEILKDFSLLKNDCLLETEFGNINCGLDEQLESIKESLYFILNER